MGFGYNNPGGGSGSTTINNIVQADPCGINEYIHNLKDFKLYFSHENQFSSLVINVNGTPATFENLINSSDAGNGRINFNSGTNGSFNKRANTVEFIKKVGDYFEVISGAEAQYDTIVIAIAGSAITAHTTTTDYRFYIRYNGYQLFNKENQLVFSNGQEAGTYRFTRTLYGFQVSKDGAIVYTSPSVCIDYHP